MFTGTGTALVTPFRTDGSLDEAALRRLVRRQLDADVDFLVPITTSRRRKDSSSITARSRRRFRCRSFFIACKDERV